MLYFTKILINIKYVSDKLVTKLQLGIEPYFRLSVIFSCAQMGTQYRSFFLVSSVLPPISTVMPLIRFATKTTSPQKRHKKARTNPSRRHKDTSCHPHHDAPASGQKRCCVGKSHRSYRHIPAEQTLHHTDTTRI